MTLVREIKSFHDCELDPDDMRFLSEFYFDARYPSADYIVCSKQDAIRGYEIVQQTYTWVKEFIAKQEQNEETEDSVLEIAKAFNK